MRSAGLGILVILSILILLVLKTHTNYIATRINNYPIRIVLSGQGEQDNLIKNTQLHQKSVEYSQKNETVSSSVDGRFSIIIVTFNEPLLYKTVNNVLTNTDPSYIEEILIVDDFSDEPVKWDPMDTRVRIIRNEKRMGLIAARYIGGNNAKGSYLAFIDAHVFVGLNWLKTPKRLLQEDPKTIVNYINFSLNATTYRPLPTWRGIGSSATVKMDLRQTWGGGSKQDDYSPITMGMFVISKLWWNQGAMDPDLKTWGGENVEISFRTWLCGGRIVIARDSFVAHGFRTKFPYPVNSRDVVRNYVRIANVWLDEEHLKKFYDASNIKVENGKTSYDIGDISERLALKEKLHCKPFSWYAEKFKGRALCLPKSKQPKNYSCGGTFTVSPKDLSYLTYEQMFFKNGTHYDYVVYYITIIMFNYFEITNNNGNNNY